MTTPVLALIPALADPGAGTGANTGTASQKGHRHHALRENTDGNKESGEAGRFAGPSGWPGASCSPLFFHRLAARQLAIGGCR